MIFGKNPWTWLRETIRSKGVIRPVKIAWQVMMDYRWERRHGTETLVRIEGGSLETDSANKHRATCYGATRARPLQQLFERLALPRTGTFVDLGAGKGRVLILAAQYGFPKVVGVEFSEALCQVARRNLEESHRRNPWPGQVDVVHADVVAYAIQPDDCTFFLYDPFNAEVLAQVLENLRRSLAAHPRRLCLIYNAPRHHDVVAASGLFAPRVDHEIGGNEFAVYFAHSRPG